MTTWTKETILDTGDLTTSTEISVSGANLGLTTDTDLMVLANNLLTLNGALTVSGAITSTGTITGSLATAAQTNITSLGTLTALQVDNINLNTNTINATSGDLTITAAGGDISFGDDNIATTGNLDAVDIDGNVQLDGELTVSVDGTGKDVKFFGTTTGNYVLWNKNQDRLELSGKGINLTQLGDGNYQPNINFYNYDADKDDAEGLAAINFYTSKSNTEAHVATDADAHLGRITFRGNTGSDWVYGASMAAAQCASYGSGNYIANEIYFRADAKQADGSTNSGKLSWAPPASAADNTSPNLILDGRSANIDQACGNQIIIKNGTPPSAHTDNYIYIGSKDSTGLATDGATLSLFVEGTVQNTALDAVGTLSHRICVWVNGTEYYLYLDPV